MAEHGRLTRTQAFAAIVFWLAVSGLYVGQTLTMRLPPGVRIRPLEAFVWNGGFYVLWIPITLAVWRLTAGWMPTAIGWPGYFARHVMVAAPAIVLHLASVIALATAVLGPNPAEPFLTMLGSQLRTRPYLELITYAGVVACGHAFWLHTRWRDRDAQASQLEAQLSAARLSALEAQIQPHFLFNSLHTIASLARDGRNADVVRLIADLSDLLRAVTDQQRSTRPLADEVALAQKYLDIQQARFGDRLRVDIDVRPDAARVFVPTLTLQPLVDNAIRHGTANTVGASTIAIRATTDAALLLLTVEDDGAGAPAEWNLETSSGTGLKNLRTRLGLLYGDRADLSAGTSPAGGFSVTVRVPKENA